MRENAKATLAKMPVDRSNRAVYDSSVDCNSHEALPLRPSGRSVCCCGRFFYGLEAVHSMTVVKKINNNAAICRDGNGRELIAFGRGIGFPHTPYELTDLSRIDRTFYNVSSQYIPLLNDIPQEIIQFTARMVTSIQDRLPYETNSNLVLTLADHISFAIERSRRGIYVRMPSIYEIEMNYPLETEIGRKFVSAIRSTFKVKLPKGEIQGIAMHFINARDRSREEDGSNLEEQSEEILEQTTQIIEQEMDLQVRRDTFNYARFATHLRYLLQRVQEEKHIDSSNVRMYLSIQEEYPQVSACVDKIAGCYQDRWSIRLSEEEKLYLIMHVNRVCSKESV